MEKTIAQQISENLMTHLQNNWQDIFGDCEKIRYGYVASGGNA